MQNQALPIDDSAHFRSWESVFILTIWFPMPDRLCLSISMRSLPLSISAIQIKYKCKRMWINKILHKFKHIDRVVGLKLNCIGANMDRIHKSMCEHLKCTHSQHWTSIKTECNQIHSIWLTDWCIKQTTHTHTHWLPHAISNHNLNTLNILLMMDSVMSVNENIVKRHISILLLLHFFPCVFEFYFISFSQVWFCHWFSFGK